MQLASQPQKGTAKSKEDIWDKEYAYEDEMLFETHAVVWLIDHNALVFDDAYCAYHLSRKESAQDVQPLLLGKHSKGV